MSALHFRKIPLQPSDYTVELRQRVERLERLRVDACMHREREKVELIDKQIQHAIEEWKKSFSVESEQPLRRAG